MISYLKERWAVLKEALGASRYGLPNLVRGLVVLIGAAYLWAYGHAMTWLELTFVSCAVGFSILFWVLLDYCVKLTKQIREGRVQLSSLRKRGVELRNYGQGQVTSDASYDRWAADTLQWEKDVVAAIAKISAADAEWFEIMDVVPRPRLPLNISGVTNQQVHVERYNQLDYQLKRLGEMIRDLWGRS